MKTPNYPLFILTTHRAYFILILLGLSLAIFTVGASLAVGQEQTDNSCPIVEAINDVLIDTPQVEPDCQSEMIESSELHIQDWTTIAAAGTVDEADTSIVNFNTYIAQILPTAPLPANLDIRYNVVAVDGLFAGGDGYRLTVRFRDNGSAARVVVRLKRYNFDTGTLSTLMTLNSNSWPASTATQTRSVAVCSPSWGFDFQTYAYFVETTVTKSATGGNPALAAIKIGPAIC